MVQGNLSIQARVHFAAASAAIDIGDHTLLRRDYRAALSRIEHYNGSSIFLSRSGRGQQPDCVMGRRISQRSIRVFVSKADGQAKNRVCEVRGSSVIVLRTITYTYV